MAHFAEVDENGTVLNVLVVDNKDCGDLPFPESEAIGQNYLASLFGGDPNRWKQTSYNNTFRFRYASIGGTFDAARDVFITPKPFASWVLNVNTNDWDAPIPMPSTGNWTWDELNTKWV